MLLGGSFLLKGVTILCGGFVLLTGLFSVCFESLVWAQPAPPIIPEPSASVIARALEAERARRESELQSPLTQIAIRRGQQIQVALSEIKLESQMARTLIENNLEKAQKATTPELAAQFYGDIIRLDYAFRITLRSGWTTG